MPAAYSLVRRSVCFCTALLLLCGLIGCGSRSSGGGGSNPPPPATTLMQFKIGDAESDRLLSFTATLNSVSLAKNSGGSTNLLAGATTIELTRTAGKMEPIAQVEVPQGTYTSLQYQVSNIKITAWDVTTASFQDYAGSGIMSGSVQLSPGLSVGSAPQIIDLDLDLKDSISFDTSGAILIAPQFALRAVNIGSPGAEVAEDGSAEDMIGVVQSMSASTFTMSLGSGNNTVQVAFDNATQGQSPGLLARDALVEVDAETRPDGSLYANRIDFIEIGNFALVEGVVTGPIGYPPMMPPGGDAATIVVQKTWAPPQTTVPNIGDTLTLNGLSSAAYSFDSDKLDSWALGFLAFSNSSMWTGQSVLALVTPGTGAVTALKVKLVEIATTGLVQGYDPSSYGFTLRVPADSAYQNVVNLSPATYLTVWDQSENKTLWNGFSTPGSRPLSLPDGTEIRVRGLAFWWLPLGYTPGGPEMLPTRIDYLTPPGGAVSHAQGVTYVIPKRSN